MRTLLLTGICLWRLIDLWTEVTSCSDKDLAADWSTRRRSKLLWPNFVNTARLNSWVNVIRYQESWSHFVIFIASRCCDFRSFMLERAQCFYAVREWESKRILYELRYINITPACTRNDWTNITASKLCRNVKVYNNDTCSGMATLKQFLLRNVFTVYHGEHFVPVVMLWETQEWNSDTVMEWKWLQYS